MKQWEKKNNLRFLFSTGFVVERRCLRASSGPPWIDHNMAVAPVAAIVLCRPPESKLCTNVCPEPASNLCSPSPRTWKIEGARTPPTSSVRLVMTWLTYDLRDALYAELGLGPPVCKSDTAVYPA